MATDTNIRVINNEDPGLSGASDGLIMSDDLLERMGIAVHNDLDVTPTMPSAEACLSIGSELYNATIKGYLHTIQFTDIMSISFEVAKCNSEMLQILHHITSNKLTSTVDLAGDSGFESLNSTISSFGLVKMAPHSFLLTITFGSDSVTFR